MLVYCKTLAILLLSRWRHRLLYLCRNSASRASAKCQPLKCNSAIIADTNYIIRNIRVCPGSANDRHIWRFSEMKNYLESLRSNINVVAEEGHYYLLGDSGYTSSPILLTPVINAPENTPEARYTTEHVQTRCKVEQTFGILVNTWRAISKGRTLYYEPEKVGKIITACAVLHNYRKMNGLPDDIIPINNILPNYDNMENNGYVEGIIEQQNIIRALY